MPVTYCGVTDSEAAGMDVSAGYSSRQKKPTAN